MTYTQAAETTETHLLPLITALYGLEGYDIRRIRAHEAGRNVAYVCDRAGADAKILRVAFLPDRSREDLLGEVEFIRYLHENGGSVANVLDSRRGNLLEELSHGGGRFFVCLFERAPGKRLVDNGYRYREGVPLSEYFYNCGKTLGGLHRLAKEYVPVHRRYGFFDKYNAAYLDELLPSSLSPLKAKLGELLRDLEGLDRGREAYGMIHFDFNDGNYHIDFDTGRITVYDFDNSCFGWYLYDLADLWTHGTGWVQFEPDAGKRRAFMEEYFGTVLAGYRSETRLDDATLARLPLLLKATHMEGLVDTFEVARQNGEEPEWDGELAFRVKCLEEDIPFRGFFHGIYDCKRPFQL